jgi:hypothetical protein
VWWQTEDEFGALWAAAFIRCQGDALITISEAAEIAGVSLATMAARVDRGAIHAYIDPTEPNPQRRRRVRRAQVEA